MIRIEYENCHSGGYGDEMKAPYISHLGFMSDTTTGDMLFGVT